MPLDRNLAIGPLPLRTLTKSPRQFWTGSTVDRALQRTAVSKLIDRTSALTAVRGSTHPKKKKPGKYVTDARSIRFNLSCRCRPRRGLWGRRTRETWKRPIFVVDGLETADPIDGRMVDSLASYSSRWTSDVWRDKTGASMHSNSIGLVKVRTGSIISPPKNFHSFNLKNQGMKNRFCASSKCPTSWPLSLNILFSRPVKLYNTMDAFGTIFFKKYV